VNSVAFLAFGTFVSHISGHATRSAVEYSEGHFHLAATFFLATALFMAGALTTTLCLRGESVEKRTRAFALPLVLELGILVVVLAQATSHVVYAFSFAMGLQNALVRQASGTIVRTTHVTGIATDIGIALGTALLSFLSEARYALRSSWRMATLAHVGSALLKVFRFERLLLHLTLFVAFLVGAFVGALGFQSHGFDILYCPVAVLSIIIVRELTPRRRRKDTGPHEGPPAPHTPTSEPA
jgi:uncharacterized membrane protein YoaK (UPF0700 family)